MKTFVMGDAHGGFKALKQVLKKSKFDYKEDKLICLGDIADGWNQTPEALEELLKIKNLIFIIGNHDEWLIEWLEKGKAPLCWTKQGGQATIDAYEKQTKLKKKHLKFLKKAPFYYIDEENRCFVHGGIKPGEHPSETSKNYLVWNRDIWYKRYAGLGAVKFDNFNEVYVGHTSIYEYSKTPLPFGNVWFMDTGGGWEGKLSMIDIESKEIFQSEKVSKLYKKELDKKKEEKITNLLMKTI